MICPKCKSDTLNEEKDMVICLNCGFKVTLREYNLWKKIYKEKPRRMEKIKFDENKETYLETYTKIRDLLPDKSIQILIGALLLVIIFLIIALI
jgi:hypothetical protein